MNLGIYRNMPESEYRAIDAVNQSILKHPTPLHIKYALDNPSEPSEAALIGSVAHTLALEPELFAGRYAVMPDLTVGITNKDGSPSKNPKNTAAYKEKRAAWMDEHKHVEVLEHDLHAQASAIAKAVRQHEDAAIWLDAPDNRELSAVWKDEATGLLCKGRFDVANIELGALVDIKTTRSAEPHAFSKSIFDFGYHIQAAHYLNGAQALGLDVNAFAIVAVEKEAPYAVQVFELNAEAIEYGRKVLAEKLIEYAECKAADVWPGYPSGVNEVTLPAWAWSRIRKEAEEWVR